MLKANNSVSSVSIVNFEQVNVSWEDFNKTIEVKLLMCI